MANIKSIGGNPIVLGLDGLDEDVLAAIAAQPEVASGTEDEAAWLQRETAAGFPCGGRATVKAIKGKTVVWNQLVQYGNFVTTDHWSLQNGTDMSMTASGNVLSFEGTTSAYLYILGSQFACKSGHKYLVSVKASSSAGKVMFIPSGVSSDGYQEFTNVTTPTRLGWIFTAASDFNSVAGIRFRVTTQGTSETITGTLADYCFFDLTLMFGAGNEPSTVAEFERLYPEAYYPYSAPTLQSAKPTGIESVGFNQWDEEWEVGSISTSTGNNTNSSANIRSKNYCPMFPNTAYCFRKPVLDSGSSNIYFYDSDHNFISYVTAGSSSAVKTFTSPAGTAYFRLAIASSYGTTYKHDICINISGSRNGEYEPHWSQALEIPLATLKPEGLRSAGNVCDELTADALVTRVGSRAYQSGDESDATVTTDGTTTHYPLSTPTTTPIDPPIPMTYRTEAGGTETVTHTEATSAPTLDVVYEIDGTAAAASIAPLEGRIASTTYAVGSLLMLGGTLVKVTTAIATGEQIIIGQNCTATTVAAELAALA